MYTPSGGGDVLYQINDLIRNDEKALYDSLLARLLVNSSSLHRSDICRREQMLPPFE